MYKGFLFEQILKFAKSMNPRKIFILSAKYGVLELDDWISPYNITLNKKNEKEKKEWAYNCYKQLKEKNINFEEKAIFLCGENYRKYLIKCFKNSASPTHRMRIGEQNRFYTQNNKI